MYTQIFFSFFKEICSCSSAGAAEGGKKSTLEFALMTDFLPIKETTTHADGFEFLNVSVFSSQVISKNII